MPQKYSTTFVSPSHFFTFNQYDYFGIKTKEKRQYNKKCQSMFYLISLF
ncbi:hypothetical protein HDEF_1389 [Candidatus Hamiltonella defensa 5AT (Acyrthosiphon pisum)]|uniref:Uncharacterized protein n=1 Tax=Hamiltonella defensa subsp. Acyrthosiphon pisum (strain 5AT) TaxID=572265 RepID=C4K629_HAMD5|nr:hypothetical protein HDEF_1389 [Candidatus Hamiltonella defensa 5AT (Acyrthosiphon pisum)]